LAYSITTLDFSISSNIFFKKTTEFTSYHTGFAHFFRTVGLSIHANEELVVILCILHVFEKGIHGFFAVHIGQMIP